MFVGFYKNMPGGKGNKVGFKPKYIFEIALTFTRTVFLITRKTIVEISPLKAVETNHEATKQSKS